eukprot:5722832-Pyramimonas_sp.AAC.1
MAEPSFVTTNDGVKLAYHKYGSEGPAVVLIHGWSGSRHYFRDSIEVRASMRRDTSTTGPSRLITTRLKRAWVPGQTIAKSCRVYAYDLRGHGDSDKPAWGSHVARLAADLRDFLTGECVSDVKLCFLSCSREHRRVLSCSVIQEAAH